MSSAKFPRNAWASLTHDSLDTAQLDPDRLGSLEFVLINIGLLSGNILVLFNTGAFASVSLHASGELGVSPSHATWMQTYYFISLALALPVSTWAAAAVGELRLYLLAMSVLLLASCLCAATTDLNGFLIGRSLQGFSGGLTIPLSQTLLMREYPQKSRGFAVALWSIAALSPFTLGPAAGGWVADQLGWRWLFYLNIPLALLSITLAWALLPKHPAPRTNTRLDTLGLVLLGLSLFCGQTVLNSGQDADWFNSPALMTTAGLGMLVLVTFIIWELAETRPLIDLRLLARRNFVIGSLGLSLSFMLMYGLLALLLVRLQSVAGYTSFLAGSVLLPLVFLAKPLASVMHHLVQRFDTRLLASINLLLFAWYCAWSSQFDFFSRLSWFTQPLWSQVLEGFCLGGLFVPLTTLFLSGLTPRRQIQAVELGGMLRVLGGSVASPLFGLLWERRTAFHQHRLLESLGNQHGIVSTTLSHLQYAGFSAPAAQAKLTAISNQHAGILALNDCFRLTAWLFVALAALVWLAHPHQPKLDKTTRQTVRETALEELMEEP
ncbi:DHA2 family efflux MFS transporter permease subunit [Methylomonas paludis]|nr:DHA2 family efflux MFS transporter permease subunit [Methylomonas paludis]